MGLPPPLNSKGEVVPVVYDKYVEMHEEQKQWDELVADGEKEQEREQEGPAVIVPAAVPVVPVPSVGAQPPKRGPGRPTNALKPAPKNQPSLFSMFGKKPAQRQPGSGSPSRKLARVEGTAAAAAADPQPASRTCRECNGEVEGAHFCDRCEQAMHGFCRQGIGEEGYGQKRRCSYCS
jgi:hypothetical protein